MREVGMACACGTVPSSRIDNRPGTLNEVSAPPTFGTFCPRTPNVTFDRTAGSRSLVRPQVNAGRWAER
jgi:hypothetical protein